MERTVGGGNLNVNGGGTGIITIVTNQNNNQNNHNNSNHTGSIVGSPGGLLQRFQTVPHLKPQVVTPGLALVRPPAVSSILQDALRGQPQRLGLFHSASQNHQMFYQQQHHQLNQQQQQIEMDLNVNPLTNISGEELTNQIFKKYFHRHPSADQTSFRNEERALQKAIFDFILNVPIIIDGNKVPRKAWAKAFYEMDVIQSAKCLFEALFDQVEMSKCTLNGKNGTEELSAVKMLAIMRASCWMKNKEQDPYSFNPGHPNHNVFPSKDERDKIEKKVFTERRSQANRKIGKILKAGNKRAHNRFSPQDNMDTNSRLSGDSDSQHSEAFHIDTMDNTSIKSEGSVEGVKHHVNNLNGNGNGSPTEDFELEELYSRFSDDFLEKLLPHRTETLIDGILIPSHIWERALQEAEKDTVKAAWTLFQFLFSNEEIMNCTLNGKNGTTELCPVRKLAIIRAVQWMSKNTFSNMKFDSDVDSCNLFPSEEDKERIETKVFTEKRYQHSRQLNTKYGIGSTIVGGNANPNNTNTNTNVNANRISS